MHQRSATLRFAFVLFCAFGPGCDGPAAPAEQPPEGSNAPVSATDPEHENVQVDIVLNKSPRVTSMRASAGRVEAGVPFTLLGQASDPDGDPVTFTWRSSCSGWFDHDDVAQVVFTADVLGAATSCAFEVIASDGRGGAGRGTLVLTTVAPTVMVGATPVSPDTDGAGSITGLPADRSR